MNYYSVKSFIKMTVAMPVLASLGLGLSLSSASAETAAEIVAKASLPISAAPNVPAAKNAVDLKGAKVHYISAGLVFPFSQQVLKGVQDASALLGMEVVVTDAAGDASKASSFIDRAIGQKASAIVLQGVDPYTVEASVRDAKAAGIPVISMAGLLSGPIPADIAEAGVVANVAFSSAEAGRLLAAYVAANSAADAHVGVIGSSTFRIDGPFIATFESSLKEFCAGCVLTKQDSPLPQWQTTLSSLARTMVTVDPKITYVVPIVDAMAPTVKSAIAAAGAEDRVKIASHNASLPDMQAIASKTDMEVANVGVSNERLGWATVDQIVRLKNGIEPVVEDQPFRMFTRDNIDQIDLKTEGADWFGFDYRKFYAGLWGVN